MRTGFVILAHERLDRVTALAGHLLAAGAPVVIHLDKRVPELAARGLAEKNPGATIMSTQRSEWGMFGLVAATLDSMRALMRQGLDLRHICLLSGSCLPLRPLEELEEFLARNPEVDFIESVPGREAAWVQGGLSKERFTLWFPFSWKNQRAAFDFFVDLQRACKIRRRIPEGVAPHLGLQWWCLSQATLAALLNHPRLPEFMRYFRHTWIPDESFFQSLVRLVAIGEVRSQPLTLQRFDRDGRPLVFHDDHEALLNEADHFFARKIDPDAHGLYRRFLSDPRPATWDEFVGMSDHDALDAETNPARGLIAPGRFKDQTSWARSETARPYLVLYSQDPALLQSASDRLARLDADITVHGRLFRADAPGDFEGGGTSGPGNLSSAPLLRDYRPAQFLARLIWLARDRIVAFLMTPEDEEYIRVQLITDPNARVVVLGQADRAEAVIERLARPVPFIRKRLIKKPKRLRRASWYRAVDPGAIEQELSQIVEADLSDPAFWSVPR